MEQQDERAQQEQRAWRDTTTQRKSYGTDPHGEVDGVPDPLSNTMEAVSKQLHHAGRTQHAALHTLGSTVHTHMHAAARSDGCVGMQLPDHKRSPGGESREHDLHNMANTKNPDGWMER